MNKFFNFLGLAKKSGSIIEGYSKCNEQRNKINLFLFIISNDASESTKKKFVKHCIQRNIPYVEAFSKEELGYAIGREEVKVLAISDKNIAKRLLELYKESTEQI